MKDSRGFTLLEVMVAMAILALGLTTILSSQTGLFAATRRVQNETYAASLMRCKMTEIELELLRDGYPLLDQNDSGDCCDEEEIDGFRCEWQVQTIELPQPATFDEDPEAALEDAEEENLDAQEAGADDLAAANPLTTGFGDVGGVDDLAGSLGESASGGGMIGMALQMVYPTLKPMLEASIRKVIVKVIWDEGKKEREFEVVQYVTNPMEGELNPNAAEDFAAMLDGMGVNPSDITGSGSPGSGSSSESASVDGDSE